MHVDTGPNLWACVSIYFLTKHDYIPVYTIIQSGVACNMIPSPITRRQILDSSKLKEFADDNFKFDENGRKLSKRVENTVGKGEIARYEQFLLFQWCFQKACFPGASKGVIVWEWVNPFPNMPWFLLVCCTSLLKTLWEKEKLLVTSNFSFSHSVFKRLVSQECQKVSLCRKGLTSELWSWYY